MRHFLIFGAIILSACSQAAKTPIKMDKAHPFTGCWESEDGQAREIWSADPSGWLFGYAVNRDADQKVTFFEQMRIADGVLTVIGPNDDAVSFKQVQDSPDYIFENPDHDYPQRIIYRPSQDRLDAVISFMDGSQKVPFNKRACRE